MTPEGGALAQRGHAFVTVVGMLATNLVGPFLAGRLRYRWFCATRCAPLAGPPATTGGAIYSHRARQDGQLVGLLWSIDIGKLVLYGM